MLRRLLFVLPLLIAAGAVLIHFAIDRTQTSGVAGLPPPRPAPEMTLPPVEGLDRPGFSTADLRRGELALVNVFASWCLPCRAEHPLLTALAEQQGLVLFGINYRDKPADAQAWLAELGNPYRAVGADPDGRIAASWRINGVPESFLIDGAGRIVYRHPGPLHAPEVEQILQPLLQALR